MFDRIGDAVVVAQLPSTQIVLWNDAASPTFGYSEREARQLRLADLIPQYAGSALEGLGQNEFQQEGGPLELRGCHKDGHDIEIEGSVGLVPAARESSHVLLILRDISTRKRLEAVLADHALHDQLTGLPNRWLFEDRFRQLMLSARRTGSSFAVLMADLDGFKQLNDQFGHVAGDEVLRFVGRRLCSAVRESDTVARVGGDEFLLLLGEAELWGGGEVIARRLLESLARPMTIAGTPIRVRASLGVAVFPRDGDDMDALVDHADQAMYRAKRERTGYRLVDDERHAIRSLVIAPNFLPASA